MVLRVTVGTVSCVCFDCRSITCIAVSTCPMDSPHSDLISSYPETRGGRGAPAFLLLLLPQNKAFTATAKPRCDHR